jgi:hypothetical protein
MNNDNQFGLRSFFGFDKLLISLGLMTCGLGVALILYLLLSPNAPRYCKPVVPQINVNFINKNSDLGFKTLLLYYDEKGSSPFSQKIEAETMRLSSCSINGERCKGTRARYELRIEKPRFQSVRILGMTGKGNNPLIGGVRWNGPSYSDRIDIECNVKDQNPTTSCRVRNIYNSADADVVGEDERVRREFDQCYPLT